MKSLHYDHPDHRISVMSFGRDLNIALRTLKKYKYDYKRIMAEFSVRRSMKKREWESNLIGADSKGGSEIYSHLLYHRCSLASAWQLLLHLIQRFFTLQNHPL